MTETIGQRIRRLRQERGLSLRDLAEPGVSYTYLSRVETGHRMPSVQVIRKLARRLSVPAEYVESGVELNSREELELALADLELAVRLEPDATVDLETRFQALIDRAEHEAEDYLAARAKAGLGVRLSGCGRLTEAITLIEEALSHPLATPGVFTEAYVTLAVTYIRAGREREAAVFCEHALARTPPDDGAVRLMLATHLSTALADLGEFQAAETVLDEIVEATRGADPYTRVRVHWSQARLATARDKRQLALRHMQKAITILEGTEDTIRLARAHILCAQILLWGDRGTGAEQHLRAARALLPAHAGPEDTGALMALEALFAARQGRRADAAARAETAIAILGQNEPGQAAASYALGLAASSAGRYPEAEMHFERTLKLLEKAHMWREANMVAHDCAKALQAAGNQSDAERCLERAAGYVTRGHQPSPPAVR